MWELVKVEKTTTFATRLIKKQFALYNGGINIIRFF